MLEGCIWNLNEIGPVVSEKFFVNVDRQMTFGHDHKVILTSRIL